jgi:hypothetical protein
MSQSASEIMVGQPDDLLVMVSSADDEEDDCLEEYERENDHTRHVKPLTIHEEVIKAKRRASLLAVPSYKSFAFEDESIVGLTNRRKPRQTTMLATKRTGRKEQCTSTATNKKDNNRRVLDFQILDGVELDEPEISLDLDFVPLSFDTVIDEASGKPIISCQSTG